VRAPSHLDRATCLPATCTQPLDAYGLRRRAPTCISLVLIVTPGSGLSSSSCDFLSGPQGKLTAVFGCNDSVLVVRGSEAAGTYLPTSSPRVGSFVKGTKGERPLRPWLRAARSRAPADALTPRHRSS
jgi:hypothetical protein